MTMITVFFFTFRQAISYILINNLSQNLITNDDFNDGDEEMNEKKNLNKMKHIKKQKNTKYLIDLNLQTVIESTHRHTHERLIYLLT